MKAMLDSRPSNRAPGFREPDMSRAPSKREGAVEASPRAVRARINWEERQRQEQWQQQHFLEQRIAQQHQREARDVDRASCHFIVKRPGGGRLGPGPVGGCGAIPPVPSAAVPALAEDPHRLQDPLQLQARGAPVYDHAPSSFPEPVRRTQEQPWRPVEQAHLHSQGYNQRPLPRGQQRIDFGRAHSFHDQLSDVSRQDSDHHFSSEADGVPSDFLQTPALTPHERGGGDWHNEVRAPATRTKLAEGALPSNSGNYRIPTPARSFRGAPQHQQEVTVQEDAASRYSLQNIIRQNGRPSVARLALPEPTSSRLGRLVIPDVQTRVMRKSATQSSIDANLVTATEMTTVIKEMSKSLSQAWDFDPFGNDERVESDIGRWLCGILRRAERECANIMIEKMPPARKTDTDAMAAPTLDALAAREAQLVAQLQEAKALQASIAEHQEDIERLGLDVSLDELPANTSHSMAAFLKFLQSSRDENHQVSRAQAAAEAPVEIDQFRQAFALLEKWYQTLHVEIEDAHHALDAKDLLLNKKAFGHMWPDGANARNALSNLL